MATSYKNVRIRHASGAPINAATPLPAVLYDNEGNPVSLVNTGTEENPEYALKISGDLNADVTFPTGADALLKDKTITDIITDDGLDVNTGALSSASDSVTAVTTGLNTLVGEVQASPTSNTLLDRVKTVGTNTGNTNTALGEVQASPTANTVLDRLKTIATNAAAALSAGENHIGAVGGHTAQIQPSITVDTAAYHANDCVGGKLTLTNAMRVSGGTGILQSLFLMDRSGTQKPALEIIIFNADPSASTLTDNAAIVIHADDINKVIRRISVAATDWILVGGVYMADLSPGSRMLAASGSANLYAAVMCTGTPDFVAGTDLILRFGIIQD